MQKYKTYVKILFLALLSIVGAAFLYLYIFSKIYPFPVLHRISLDAKINFIKDHIDIDKVDTIIVGSSIGLNDVQGAVLEKSCKKCQSVLNLSGFELRPPQVEQILELATVFPNLKRIIYSAQFSDFSEYAMLEDYNPNMVRRYLTNSLVFPDYISIIQYSDIISCIKRQWDWKTKYMLNNQFTYLGFDSTGSVPLHIYGRDIVKDRWEQPHSAKQDKRNYLVLKKMVKKAKKDDIHFYFIMEPYREPLVKKFKHVRPTMVSFEHSIKKIVVGNDGIFLNLHDKLHLNDDYFADRSHLNDKGSAITAEEIGKFIDGTNKD